MDVQDFGQELIMTADGSDVGEGEVDQSVREIRACHGDREATTDDASSAGLHLAEMFRASRSTAREALRVPSTDDAVALRSKAGPLTIDTSTRNLRDIQGFRRLIEVNLAEELISRSSADLLARLDTINEAMRRANSAAEAAEIDYGFHRTLVDSVDNHTLSEMYRILRPTLRRLMETGKTRRQAVDGAYTEHTNIVAALRTRDRLAYTFHMTQHLNAGLEFIAAPEIVPPGDGPRG